MAMSTSHLAKGVTKQTYPLTEISLDTFNIQHAHTPSHMWSHSPLSLKTTFRFVYITQRHFLIVFTQSEKRVFLKFFFLVFFLKQKYIETRKLLLKVSFRHFVILNSLRFYLHTFIS